MSASDRDEVQVVEALECRGGANAPVCLGREYLGFGEAEDRCVEALGADIGARRVQLASGDWLSVILQHPTHDDLLSDGIPAAVIVGGHWQSE
jgi:hypothetical protein